MEPSSLAERLDQIGEADLGVVLDHTQLWEKLDSRLNSRARVRRIILVAASFALLILLIPLGFQDTKTPTEVLVEKTAPERVPSTPIEKKEPIVPIYSAVEATAILVIDSKRTTPVLAAVPEINQLVNAELVNIPKPKRYVGDSFDNRDVAVIQSSLDKSGKKADKKLKIKATWHFYTSTSEEVENQN